MCNSHFSDIVMYDDSSAQNQDDHITLYHSIPEPYMYSVRNSSVNYA